MWSRALVPLELLYRGGVRARRLLFDLGVFKKRRLPVPVVSVGNLTVGGTGKTPLTIAVAREAFKRGFRPAVLTRGYGGRAGNGVHAVSDGRNILLDAVAAGDEARLMAENLPGVPVVKCPERYDGGLFAVEQYDTDLLILDDGYQHWKLARDLDILVVDRAAPAAEGYCLPAGSLREPPSAAARAGVVFAVGEGPLEHVAEVLNLPHDVPVFPGELRLKGYRPGRGRELRSLEELRGRRVFVFCGIARPERFLRSVEALGTLVVGWKTFRDHHRYRPGEEEQLERLAVDAGSEMLLTTEKDAVRLNAPSFGTIVAEMECENAFFDFVFDNVRVTGIDPK